MKRIFFWLLRRNGVADTAKTTVTGIFLEALQPIMSMDRFPTLIELKVAIIFGLKVAGISMLKRTFFKTNTNEKNLGLGENPRKQAVQVYQGTRSEGGGGD